jgi:microcystin-dependent protein
VAQPYIGEIRMFCGNFAPLDWALCNGQLLPIANYDALFNLIGTTYGGDGVNTFALPNLQSRVPIHQGGNYVMGQAAGEEAHTLITSELPAHTHTVAALTAANALKPAGAVYGGNSTAIYATASSATMNGGMVAANPGGQPHNNMMPYLAVNFIIALFGIYPSQG